MQYSQYTSKKIVSILKSLDNQNGELRLRKPLKGYAYAECKPHGAACIVNLIAQAGSLVIPPNPNVDTESTLEEFVATVNRRMLRVTQIEVHSIILLPPHKALPKNFLSFDAGKVIMDYKPFAGATEIEYAHSSRGDLYIKGSTKGCAAAYAFPFFLNASDAVLTAMAKA